MVGRLMLSPSPLPPPPPPLATLPTLAPSSATGSGLSRAGDPCGNREVVFRSSLVSIRAAGDADRDLDLDRDLDCDLGLDRDSGRDRDLDLDADADFAARPRSERLQEDALLSRPLREGDDRRPRPDPPEELLLLR